MATKRRSPLGPKVRLLLEQALLEALKRHLDGKSPARGKSAPARKKKAGKKKVSRRPAKKRARKRRA
jgi:hypothetical protein